MSEFKTKIGNCVVAVKKANFPSIVSFRAGEHGKKERGDFHFWTAVFKKPIGGKKKIFGRAFAALPPGDRFDRMKIECKTAIPVEDRKIYRKYWSEYLMKGANIKYVRPSTLKEIKKWRKSHLSDEKHIFRLIINGKIVK